MIIDVAKGQELLLKQVGKPYVFGYEVKLDDPNPEAFDCSELVQWFFHQMGIYVPDGSYNQYPVTTPVISPAPFDLWFLHKQGRVHHVGIVLDDKSVIHAKGMASGVVVDFMSQIALINGFSGWRRPKCLIG